MEQFTQCPRRWKLTKIDRVPRAPAEALIFGDAIHAAIQADAERLRDGVAPLSEAQIAVQFEDALQRRWRADDPSGLLAARLPEWKLRGLATINAYCTRVQPWLHPLDVEASFSVALPDPAMRAAGWRFTGRLDARTPGDAYKPTTIVDWKTSGTPWQDGVEHRKPQAAAYLYADRLVAEQKNAEAKRIVYIPARRVTFVVFASRLDVETGQAHCTVQMRPTERTAEQITTYAYSVCQTAQNISDERAQNRFPAHVGPLCCWCDCFYSCADGQAYAATSGRAVMVPPPPLTTAAATSVAPAGRTQRKGA